MAETQALLGAGTETTGNTLSVLTYHVLANPKILKTLLTELRAAARSKQNSSFDLLNHKTLERLPHLQACVKEALRLGTGVSSRLPRLNRLAATTYTSPSSATNNPNSTYVFPPGISISMSILSLHYNATIFPEPKTFNPDRWTEPSPAMLSAFKPFGQGARQCVGLELAKEELLLMAGNLFFEFGEGMELFETTERDVSICHDFFAPFGPADSLGVRVLVK